MKKIRNFLKDRSGATAVTLALLLVPMVGMTGLAVDYTRASGDRSRLQGIADSAALAGASVFTGENKAAAEASARAYLRAHLGAEMDKMQVGFDTSNQRVIVSLAGETNTLFMKVLAKEKVAIGVLAEALAPLKPSSATITINTVTGWYYKRVSIYVTRGGKDVRVGTITYTATDHSGAGGKGSGITDPDTGKPVTFELGEYDEGSLRMVMQVKTDGCDIGYRNTSTNNKVVCKADTGSKYKTYNATYSTLDSSTYTNLFVDGVRLTATATNPLALLDCDQKEHDHWWEDGGSPASVIEPDFLYKIKAACKAVDGEYVRLTR
ncbi:Tad domain-containing protein [Phyllobacterium sp. CCNWLW109]|uniref:TadE/TadG family type IV pilus assembly protein n=1 Tax=Phyllobacterium sp. CCNWLW109 TaxID=3127479 RepID=UPI0030775EB3